MKYDVVKVKITNRCNRSCSFCVFNNNDKDLDVKEFKRMTDIIKISNLKNFISMDGEPLVNKDFCEIVKYSKEIFPDKIFVLGTNAVLLRNNNHLIEFIKENFNEICIGCDLEHKKH